MPLRALIFYIQSKYKRETNELVHETKREVYLFTALRSILMLKPDGYYSNYPEWDGLKDTENRLGIKTRKKQVEDYDDQDIIDLFKGKGKLSKR